MEKLWLKSYEQGVNPEIDISQYSSISDVFRQSVEKFSDKPAFQNMGKTLTYAEVGKLATDFASYLQNVLKLPRGERVAIMMPNVFAISDCAFRYFAGRFGGSEYESALYAARVGASVERQWRDNDCRVGELCQYVGVGVAAYANQTCDCRVGRRDVRHD